MQSIYFELARQNGLLGHACLGDWVCFASDLHYGSNTPSRESYVALA